MERHIPTLLLITFVAIGCATREPIEWTRHAEHDFYPLDDEVRKAPGATPECPVVQLLEYRGDVLPYHRPLKVNPFFRERLQQFEMVVRDVSLEIYGMEPVAIRHWGSYNCRRIRGKKRLSEHGLGNAIDIAAFDFGTFRVSVEHDWNGRHRHARFLHTLARRLAQRPDIFRGMLGPGAEGHHDHFHFDCGPHRYIEMR